MANKKRKHELAAPADADYAGLLARLVTVLEQGRRSTVRTANAILAATYWEVGRQIVEYEQRGQARAEYGEALLKRLAGDLVTTHGRGFSERNLEKMRNLYLGWEFVQTPLGRWQARVKCPLVPDGGHDQDAPPGPAFASESISPTLSAKLQHVGTKQLPPDPAVALVEAFPLPWSHYVRLMAVKDNFARWFYEDEAIQGAWSVRQLDRQISTRFFERTALSRNKEAANRQRIVDLIPTTHRRPFGFPIRRRIWAMGGDAKPWP